MTIATSSWEVDYVKPSPTTSSSILIPALNARPRPGDPARAADGLVPQHLEPGITMPAEATTGALRADGAVAIHHPLFGELELLAPGVAPDGSAPSAPPFCENENYVLERLYDTSTGGDFVSEGRHQRPCRQRSGPTVNPDQIGTKVSMLVPAAGRARRDRPRFDSDCRPARLIESRAGIGNGAHGRSRCGDRAPHRGGRRSPRRAHSARSLGRRGSDHATGLRRDAVEQAAVRVRHRSAGSPEIRLNRHPAVRLG